MIIWTQLRHNRDFCCANYNIQKTNGFSVLLKETDLLESQISIDKTLKICTQCK